MSSVPIQFSEVYAGFADSEGMLSITSDALVLEFQIKDSFVGAFKSKVKRVELPFENIGKVQLQSNLLARNLTVVVDSMQLVEDVPNAKQGEIKMKFSRSHQREAAALAREASIKVSEIRLNRLDDMLDSQKPCEDET